jgi:hypothetical protein
MTTAIETNDEPARTFRRSESIGQLVGALAKAQGQMEGAKKDAANPFFKSKYADLASVWDAIREPLSANALAVIQFPRSTEEGVEIETLLAHESGEWVAETLTLPVGKYDPQGIGSAITYAKRYSLQAMAGIPSEDDDGNAAVKAAQHSAAANGDNPRARAQAAAYAKANPPPPETPRCTQEQQDAIRAIREELGLSNDAWVAILKKHHAKTIKYFTPEQAAEVVLDLCRQRVAELLTQLGLNLDDVRREDASVAADLPEELDQDQATAALIVLREAKANAEVTT